MTSIPIQFIFIDINYIVDRDFYYQLNRGKKIQGKPKYKKKYRAVARKELRTSAEIVKLQRHDQYTNQDHNLKVSQGLKFIMKNLSAQGPFNTFISKKKYNLCHYKNSHIPKGLR